MNPCLLDRLRLDVSRAPAIAVAVCEVVACPDPVGEGCVAGGSATDDACRRPGSEFGAACILGGDSAPQGTSVVIVEAIRGPLGQADGGQSGLVAGFASSTHKLHVRVDGVDHDAVDRDRDGHVHG